MKKFLALFLALTFLCVSLTACGSSGGTNATTTATAIATAPQTTLDPSQPDVPPEDYGGHVFTVMLSVNNQTSTMWDDFTAEGETGDPINDAIYKRNQYVDDKLNVKIQTFLAPATDDMARPAAQKLLKNSIMAGDHAYDAAMLAGYATCQLASQGYLMDMNNMPPLNLTKPYWDQAANRDLMIRNKMYYTTGDIGNVVNEATYAILFNKQLIADYSLKSPYDLVNSGQWTYDKLVEMGMAVSEDLNGDGKMDAHDRFGAFVWDDTMMGVVNSIGERCATVGSDGNIVLTLNNDRVISAFNTYINFALDKTHAFDFQRTDWAGTVTNAMFQNNQGLFYLQIMELAVRLRAMDIDFGIIPYPKLDTNQTDYYSTVSSWSSGFICVPTGQEDATRTASILEVMAAESTSTLRTAYYDIALKGQLVRDDESKPMVDLIFGSKIYDLGWMYQIGGYNESIMNLLRNRKTDFASMYQKGLTKAQSDIDAINTAFNNVLS